MLIREEPATELTVATRILAKAGALSPTGRVAILVGTEVVYITSGSVSAEAMTPYDIAAVHLGDGSVLYGTPPDDLAPYLSALRADGVGAVAAAADETFVTAGSVKACVAVLLGRPWEELEREARVTGALFGAYPAERDQSD